MPVDGEEEIIFRAKFLNVLAKKVAYCFCQHPTISQMDPTRDRLPD